MFLIQFRWPEKPLATGITVCLYTVANPNGKGNHRGMMSRNET